MAKLCYITSLSHSGSTLLDILIGTLQGAFSTGEVTYLAWNLYRERHMEVSVAEQNICTCRYPFSKCQIWGEVVDRLKNTKHGLLLSESPLNYKMKFYNFTNRYDASASFFDQKLKAILIKHLKNYGNGLIPNLLHLYNRRIAENNWIVFDTLAEVTRAKIIIDSSKDIGRLYHLAQHRPDSVYIVFLVRSIFAVAASSLKRGGDPIATALDWVQGNMSKYSIIKRMPRIPSIVVWYEDYCKDPLSERNRIADFIGLTKNPEDILINSKKYHLVAGNPMRYTEDIIIRKDDSWRLLLNNTTYNAIKNILEKCPNSFKDYLEIIEHTYIM